MWLWCNPLPTSKTLLFPHIYLKCAGEGKLSHWGQCSYRAQVETSDLRLDSASSENDIRHILSPFTRNLYEDFFKIE